jgi:cytochrome c oxidase assembly protein subunit 15
LPRQQGAEQIRLAVNILLTLTAVQVALGISTLLMHVPIILAASHQAVAVLLLTAVLYIAHRLPATAR